MSENGNKGGSWLMAAVLSVLIAALALWILMLAEWREPVQKAYIDPVLSQSLVRGSIVDRNGDYLALQAPVFGFFIHLSDASAGEAASSISAYTSENAISIEEKIEQGAQFIPLGRILSSDEIMEAEERIRELGLLDDIEPGSIEMRLEPSPASHAIVSGMERLFDDALSPRPTPTDPIAEGRTIRLSIDMDLQKALEETSPSTAAIISADGEVLAFRGTPDDAMLESMVLSIGDEEYGWQGKYDWYSAPFIVYHIPLQSSDS